VNQWYAAPHKWLPSLRKARTSTRQQRSDGRERNGNIIKVLIDHLDLATLRAGIPLPHGVFIDLSMKDIALKAGWRTLDDNNVFNPDTLRNKSVKRVWRGLQELKAAGYIIIHEQIEAISNEDNAIEPQYRSLPAIKWINPLLLVELGITRQKLQAARDMAKKKRQRQQQDYARQIDRAIKGSLKGLAAAPDTRYRNNKQDYATRRREEASRKRIDVLCKQRFPKGEPEGYARRQALWNQYPHLSLEEIMAMLDAPPDKPN
jgi:hypothetical protein